MIRKLVSLAVCLLAAAVLFCLPAAAAGGSGIYGTVQGQSAVLYLRSGDAAAAYSCLVGNTAAQAGQAQPLSAQQDPVHTVILLDNSLSIPKSPNPSQNESMQLSTCKSDLKFPVLYIHANVLFPLK